MADDLDFITKSKAKDFFKSKIDSIKSSTNKANKLKASLKTYISEIIAIRGYKDDDIIPNKTIFSKTSLKCHLIWFQHFFMDNHFDIYKYEDYVNETCVGYAKNRALKRIKDHNKSKKKRKIQTSKSTKQKILSGLDDKTKEIAVLFFGNDYATELNAAQEPRQPPKKKRKT